MDTPTKLIYTATVAGPTGSRVRRVQVSLPYIASIADDPHYRPPPPIEPQKQGPRLTDRYIRRVLGKPDPKLTAQMADRIKYESTVRRIANGGV